MSSIYELGKRLQEMEQQTNELRSEVEALEATKQNLEMGEFIHNRNFESHLPDAQAGSDSTNYRQYGGRSGDPESIASKAVAMHSDFIDELTLKAGEIQCSIDERHKLLKEKRYLTAIYEDAKAAAQEAESAYTDLFDYISSNMNKKGVVLKFSNRETMNIAVRNLKALYQQREFLQTEHNMMSKELFQMAVHGNELTSARQQKQEAIEVLAKKKAKLEELRKERLRLERDVHIKDGVLEKKLPGSTKEEAIRSANYDRRVALHELEKQGKHLKYNYAVIRQRAMRIAKIEKRLELIGDAMAGGGSFSGERVDVEIVDNVVSELETLGNLYAEARMHMGKLDAQVEQFEYKVNTIKHAIHGVHKEMSNIDVNHRRNVRVLKQEVNSEQILGDQEIMRLKLDLEKLHQEKDSKKQNRRLAGRRKINFNAKPKKQEQ